MGTDIRLKNAVVRGAGVLVVLLLAAAARGADPLNVDAAFGWDRCYRPMEWTPVEIGITPPAKMKDPFGGVLEMSAQQDGLTVMHVRHPFVLTPGQPLHLPLVTKLAMGASSCDLRIADDRGLTRWSSQYDLSGYVYAGESRGLKALNSDDALVGLAGSRAFAVAALAQSMVSSAAGGQGRVYLKAKQVEYLPWDWTGYASLDLLVLYNLEWDKPERFRPEQAKAICRWVSNGGRLLIVLGGRPMPANHPIAEMLPLKIGQLRRLEVKPENVPFAQRGRPPRPAEAVTVSAWELEDVRDRNWRVADIKRFGVDPVMASGPVGFGRVGVLLFDPSELTGTPAANPAAMWVWCMEGLTGQRQIKLGQLRSSEDPYDPYGGRYRPGPAEAATNAVLDHLLQIRELRPLSIWWVIGLLSLLAVLLGPIDYLVLRKLDRLPMTWITSSVVIALFTAGAYYGVRALRAGATQVRSVTVMDGIEGGPAWATSYSGIFASDSDDYRLEGLQGSQWWSGVTPTREQDYYDYGGEEISTRKIFCTQQEGGNLPYSLPISIWSMQCLITEWPVAEMPLSAEANLTTNGDLAFVRIINRSKTPINRCWVFYGGQRQLDLRPIPGEGTAEFRQGDSTLAGTWPHENSLATQMAKARGVLQRNQAFDAYQDSGAAVIYAFYEDPPCCCQVAGERPTVAHTQLVRLVVFPRKSQ